MIQFGSSDYDEAAIVKKAEAIWTKELKNKADELKNLEVYIKPEDKKAYYVFNKKISGEFAI
jgi:hypothetical protein